MMGVIRLQVRIDFFLLFFLPFISCHFSLICLFSLIALNTPSDGFCIKSG